MDLSFFYEKQGLRNVAPLCSYSFYGWTYSTTGEILATGDGSTTSFSGTVSLPPVNPLDSFTLHYTIGGTAYSVTADADGNISDANVSGTIAQDGSYNLTFNTAPDNGTNITADYSYGIEPANLENALDPRNPNPSGWGWTSTTGAGYYAYITFTLPEDGIYLFTYTIEIEPSNPIASIRGYMFAKYPLDTYRAQTDIDNIYMDGNKIVVSGPAICKKDFRIEHYVTSACELKMRFYEFNIFKLS